MAHFASFLRQKHTQFPNGGRVGVIHRILRDLTIGGTNGGLYLTKTGVFASKWGQNHGQNANRGEGGLN